MTDFDRVTTKTNGEFIWHYNMNLFRDSSVFITLCKIMVLCTSFPYLLVIFLATIEGNFARDFLEISKVFVIIALFMIALSAFSYYIIYVPFHGSNYSIIYEMNANSIRFIESKKDTKKNELMSSIGIIAGIIAGNPTTAGANLLALSKSEMTTTFKHVNKIIIYKNQHMKLISSDLTRNLICYHKDDQTFLENYIIEHCTKAKVILK